jgi:hypothetical protein
MGLVYEHWRPDTNECFYVGASRDAEDDRPYNYGRHNDDYDVVVSFLKENGMKPFTKLIWTDLPRDCTGTFEKLRIAYQRSLLGKKLTNRAKGGDGFNYDKKEYFQTEKGKQQAKKHSQDLIEYFSTSEGKKWLEERSESRKEFLLTEEGENWLEEQSKLRIEFLSSPEGQKWCEEQSERKVAFHASPEGEQWRKDQSERRREFLDSPDGDAWRENQKVITSICAIEQWQNPERRFKQLPLWWWNSNVRYQKYWGA